MEIKKYGLLTIGLLFAMLLISGCIMTTSIEDVKNEENVGEKVNIYGTVKNTIKLGELSGYTLEDETGTIGVSSQTLPKEGSKIRVRGTLVKDTLLGYYIKVN